MRRTACLLPALIALWLLWPIRAPTAPAIQTPPGLERIEHFVFITQESFEQSPG